MVLKELTRTRHYFPSQRYYFMRAVDAANNIYARPIAFNGGVNLLEKVALETIYQDTLPEGGARATVLALHGSPGSSNDTLALGQHLKKKGIRLVALNFPGHGIAEYNPLLTNHDAERNEFAQAMIRELKLDAEPNLLVMGHSRAVGNAMDIAVKNKKNVRAAILVSPLGLRVSDVVRQSYKVAYHLSDLQAEVAPETLTQRVVQFLSNGSWGMPTPFIPAPALQTLATLSLRPLLNSIENINKYPSIRVLSLFGTDDTVVGAGTIEEFLAAFKHMEMLSTSSDSNLTRADAELQKTSAEVYGSGVHNVAVRFHGEDHFVHATRARAIAGVIDEMLLHSKDDILRTPFDHDEPEHHPHPIPVRQAVNRDVK